MTKDEAKTIADAIRLIETGKGFDGVSKLRVLVNSAGHGWIPPTTFASSPAPEHQQRGRSR